MIAALRSWLFGVTVAAFGAGLIELFQVRPEMKKTMRIVTGLFMLSVMIAPLTGLKSGRLTQSIRPDREQSSIVSAQAALDSVWKKTLEERIRLIAQEAGATLTRVELLADGTEDGCINIQSVIVYASCGDPEARAGFEAALRSGLGCPACVRWEDLNDAVE